jgi:hypothetical protein
LNRQRSELDALDNVVSATQNRVGEPVGTKYSMARLEATFGSSAEPDTDGQGSDLSPGPEPSTYRPAKHPEIARAMWSVIEAADALGVHPNTPRRPTHHPRESA